MAAFLEMCQRTGKTVDYRRRWHKSVADYRSCPSSGRIGLSGTSSEDDDNVRGRRMKITAFIFARGGSKGVPGKNIRRLAGKPLIAWSIEQALAVKRIERVLVSTDSEEIATVAREYGAEVPFIRP